MKSKKTTADQVTEARQVLEDEQRRLLADREALRSAKARISTLDPDSGSFSRAIARRNALRDRAGARAARVMRLKGVLSAAEERAADALRSSRRADAAARDRERQAIEAELTEAALEVGRRIADGAARVRRLIAEANSLERLTGDLEVWNLGRGSFWSAAEPGDELRIASLHPKVVAAAHVARTTPRG